MWRVEPKFDEQFSNQIRQITKGFKNAAGTLHHKCYADGRAVIIGIEVQH